VGWSNAPPSVSECFNCRDDMRSRFLLGVQSSAFVRPGCDCDVADASVMQVLKTSQTWSGARSIPTRCRRDHLPYCRDRSWRPETGWHEHPVPSFARVLEDVVEVRLANGTNKPLSAGEALAEVIDRQLRRNTGGIPLKLAVFYTGIVGLSTQNTR
jgi:hypothetical protein